MLVLHHIVADGWSIDVLVREMGALYGVFATGEPSPLPALPIQYADFAAWQREQLQGEALAVQPACWRERARRRAAAAGAACRPAAAGRAALPRARPAAASSPREMVPALAALCRAEGATLFMGLLAGFTALLHATPAAPTSWWARRSRAATAWSWRG